MKLQGLRKPGHRGDLSLETPRRRATAPRAGRASGQAQRKHHQSRQPRWRVSKHSQRERLQLPMMIAALWIIKDPSADNDRGTHAEERNKASQHSDHCSLPWFFCFSMHDSTHYIHFGLHRRRAVSRSRFRALTRIKLSAHGPGGTATSEASKQRFGIPALANARYAGVGTREVAAPFDRFCALRQTAAYCQEAAICASIA